MFYWLFPKLIDYNSAFNILRYLTFRTAAALFTAFLISFLLGKPFIAFLKSKQKEGQPIRLDGPESHLLTKKGTPTMGGSLILLALTLSTLLWCDLSNGYYWLVLFITLGFGAIGAYDDFLKLTKSTSKGLRGKYKLLLQGVMTSLAAYGVISLSSFDQATSLIFPFFKELVLPLGWMFIPFCFLVVVGASNAVNLTDGLDGLAIVPVMLASFCYCLIAYLVGNSIFSSYLQLPHVPHVGEISVFCGALIGAGLGFLWFNTPPAKVFMGDTGSLAVGGALGMISVVTKQEIILAIIGGVFVLEAVSVILQVGYYKLTKKRIFLMAPIHHHFEKKGWSEPTVVIRFWIIAALLALIGLTSLKIR
ncbi:MAG TPA: phospho-N-acetylmuramoyl-pentapeptide-transferase [Alphaproteobacteria bacterium]|nr:phospho-N-acetylmuramoyl-pentapeptide-transferase [Alphaproteobacteria bacterium]